MASLSETQSKHGGARVAFPPPLVFVATLLLGIALDRWVSRWPFTFSPGLRWGATGGVAAAGVGLLLWTGRLFQRSGQDPAPWKPSPSLILQGPYRFSRNPMYLSFVLMQAAIGLGLNDLWVVAFSLLALAGVHRMAVLPEEAYLSGKFGADYERYRKAVRRYL